MSGTIHPGSCKVLGPHDVQVWKRSALDVVRDGSLRMTKLGRCFSRNTGSGVSSSLRSLATFGDDLRATRSR